MKNGITPLSTCSAACRKPRSHNSQNTSIQPSELALWNVKLHPYFELGTVYTVIAGLLNLLVICDAYAGPLVIAPQDDKKNRKKEPAEKITDDKNT